MRFPPCRSQNERSTWGIGCEKAVAPECSLRSAKADQTPQTSGPVAKKEFKIWHAARRDEPQKGKTHKKKRQISDDFSPPSFL
jgi:hypothetical protein